MMSLVMREVDIIHPDFSKVSDAFSHNILTEEMMHYGLDKQTVRSIEN